MRRVMAVLVGLLGVVGAGWAQEEPSAEAFDGLWLGALDVGGPELRLVFEIDVGAGTVQVTSVDQGGVQFAADEMALEGRAIRVSFRVIAATFDGALDEQIPAISGTWSQGFSQLPLTLEPTDAPPEAQPTGLGARPQDPVGDAPYAVESFAVETGGADGVTLAGELYVPPGEGPHPGVVLVSGSGPQDRNEELMNHRPFLVLADHLARRGFAVARYDDRGAGASTGDFASASIHDFAADAGAVWTWLAADARVDQYRVGYVGHSEGAITGPLAAQRTNAGFLVLWAGPAVSLEDTLRDQLVRIAQAEGVSVAMLGTQFAIQTEVIAALSTGDLDSCIARLSQSLDDQGLSEAAPPADQMCSGALISLMDVDPRDAIQAFGGPILALFGSKDLQVAPEINVEPMRLALVEAGHPDNTLIVFEGLNHLFQTAETGALSEYIVIEETLAPAAMDAMAAWMTARVSP